MLVLLAHETFAYAIVKLAFHVPLDDDMLRILAITLLEPATTPLISNPMSVRFAGEPGYTLSTPIGV